MLPLDRLDELVAGNLLGSISPRHFGFMGHIGRRHIPTLIVKSAPEVTRKLKEDQVVLAQLTPA